MNRHGVKISGWSGEGISIVDGATYLTLDGFEFMNADTAQGGCIVIGTDGNQAAVGSHHLNLLNMKIGPTVTGPGTKGSTANATGHGLYIGASVNGIHHIVADGWEIDAQWHGMASAFHMYHSSPGRPNGSDIVFRNATVRGLLQAIILWDSTIQRVTIGPNVRIYDSAPIAVRHEYGQAVLDDVMSVNTMGTALINNGSGLTVNANCSLQ